MSSARLDQILSILIIILLAVVIWQGCSKKQSITPDSTQTIINKIESSFDSLETETLSTIVADISILDQIVRDTLNKLNKAQRELIQEVKASEAALQRENKKLLQYISIRNQYTDTIKEKIIVIDTTGKEVIVPQWFKDLPWQLRANYIDNKDYVNIFYDLLSDSVTAEINILNEFEIKQYVDDKGDPFVDVHNKNPKTYTLPGSASFQLELPTITKRKRLTAGLQIGAGITTDGKPRPYVGFGLQYNPSLNIRNIFKRK